jgi:hypothetical protein
MKTPVNKKRSRFSAVSACLFALSFVTANAAQSPANVTGDELAVWQAMAEVIASDNASHPYPLWYFRSDFASASFIASAMADPDREEFCGLSRPDAQTMISELKTVSSTPVELESSVVKSAGFKVAYKKVPLLRYFAMSRVVFDAAITTAWLSVELQGARGSIVRLDKIEGRWTRTSRCGAWYMPE